MSVTPSPIGGFAGQFFDNNGQPLSGGKIYTYAAGTTTPQATYTSALGITPHSNPIILDSAGRVPGGEIWLTDGLVYKFVIETSTTILIGTYDNITGVNSNFVNYTIQEEVITATAGQTVFNLSTINYTPGTNSLSVYIDGVNQYVGDSYLETDSDTVTFTSGLHVGAEVKFTTAIQVATGAMLASDVGFTQAGTGAVAQTVQTKLEQYVSVKDFGAVGDGITDDTAAIQAALTASSLVSGVGGTYAIASSLTVGTEKSLRDINLVALTAGMNMVLVSNKSRLENITLEGTGTVSTVERGVYPAVDGASDVVISNIKASNLTFGVHAQPLTSLIPERWSISGHIHDIVGTIGASEGYGVLLSPAKQCNINVQFDNIRRHALYMSAGSSQNSAEMHVDGCGNYAAQIFSTSAQPACEGNFVRGTFRNLSGDAAGQEGAVSIIGKSNYNDISISMVGDGCEKAVWIEGIGDAVGPYPTGNKVHDCSLYGVFAGVPITAQYASQTSISNNVVIAEYVGFAISMVGNATLTVDYAGNIEGNTIDALNVGNYGISNSYECPLLICDNSINNVNLSRVVDYSTAQGRLGFNVSYSGLATVTTVNSLQTKDITIMLPYVIENPKVQATVNSASVSTLNAPITCIAFTPSGSPMTFLMRVYNGAGSTQNITVFWFVMGD